MCLLCENNVTVRYFVLLNDKINILLHFFISILTGGDGSSIFFITGDISTQ